MAKKEAEQKNEVATLPTSQLPSDVLGQANTGNDDVGASYIKSPYLNSWTGKEDSGSAGYKAVLGDRENNIPALIPDVKVGDILLWHHTDSGYVPERLDPASTVFLIQTERRFYTKRSSDGKDIELVTTERPPYSTDKKVLKAQPREEIHTVVLIAREVVDANGAKSVFITPATFKATSAKTKFVSAITAVVNKTLSQTEAWITGGRTPEEVAWRRELTKKDKDGNPVVPARYRVSARALVTRQPGSGGTYGKWEAEIHATLPGVLKAVYAGFEDPAFKDLFDAAMGRYQFYVDQLDTLLPENEKKATAATTGA